LPASARKPSTAPRPRPCNGPTTSPGKNRTKASVVTQ
jgi:hypothetical protein